MNKINEFMKGDVSLASADFIKKTEQELLPATCVLAFQKEA